MSKYGKKMGGVTGAALQFGAGLAEGKSVYSDLGNLAVVGAKAAVDAACPECMVAYKVANYVDPAIGKDVHSFATSAAKDVCTGAYDLGKDFYDDISASGDGDGSSSSSSGSWF
jgi:hypothetical protein